MYTKQLGNRRRVVTAEGPAYHHVHLVGPHPILRHFLDRMALARIARSCLTTPRDWLLDHAQTLAIFIQNIILSPAPLYRLGEWAAPIDPDALGLSAAEQASINDDRAARTLDALVTAPARNLFFLLALHIIKQFELDTSRVHQDTTTVTFHGAYQTSVQEPRITRGKNKDHRPDLKQLVFGLNVAGDGAVPLTHAIYSGNRTDDTVHCSNVDRLRAVLQRDDFIYVADCKLCTRKNLAHIASYGGKFVTVLPRSRAEDRGFRQQLREGAPIRWRRFHQQDNQRRKSDPPDIYSTTSAGPAESSEGYRIIWCRSSEKAKLDARARQANLAQAVAELHELDAKLNKRQLRKRSALKAKVKEILRNRSCQGLLEVSVRSTVRIQTKRLRPRRPRKDDPVREVRTRVFRLEFSRNQQAIRGEARTDGVFPLVTNLTAHRASKKEVLLIYKYQPYVEKRHALLKTELGVAPVYIKKPLRAAGLVHVTFLAMTLDALIERTLRQAMEREGIESLPILPERRPTKTPTTARLLEMFSDVAWYEFQRGDETVTFPIRLSPLQKELLRLLGMHASTYA